MTPPSFQSIVHPTDFSEASDAAFAHALRIAVAARAAFSTLHIEKPEDDERGGEFPHVRRTLAAWSLLDADAPEATVFAKLGVRVTKSGIAAHDTGGGILDFVRHHACDLMVLASHDHHGMRAWFGGSLGQQVARGAHVSTLFVRANQRGFVDPDTGACALKKIVLPVDAGMNNAFAWRKIIAFAKLLEPAAIVQLLHVGLREPVLRDERGRVLDLPVVTRQGSVVEAILAFANEVDADLIAMPTAGHHGVLDALRGSTTERVLREAPCPLLAVPVE